MCLAGGFSKETAPAVCVTLTTVVNIQKQIVRVVEVKFNSCGQLISGCVWDIREQLIGQFPNGDDIISSLAINSILLHNGSGIAAAIPIDFLTLDDDDSDIQNGTPHYTQIANGFNNHGIFVPQITFLNMALASELPSHFNPNGGDEITLSISNGVGEYPKHILH